MATRFTDDEKWGDPWFRRLKPYEKLLFVFLCDNCNWAGFYELDEDYIKFHIGQVEGAYNGALDGALKALSDKIIIRDGWVWVRNFLKHQRNEVLNPNNPAHKNIIQRINDQLDRFSGVPQFDEMLGLQRGIQWGIKSPIGKEEEKETVKEKEYGEQFLKFWELYPVKVGKMKAWSLWKKHGLNKRLDEVLTALEMYCESEQWLRDGGKYIPHPSTWLSQGRYDDTPKAQQRKKNYLDEDSAYN